MTAVFSACRGDARRADGGAALTVKIGTFLSDVTTLAGMQSAEPLLSIGWDGRPVKRLAESATESPDGRSLTVTLRSNVKFHTGEVVTAARVRELILPKLPKYTTEVANLEVVDDRTLVFHLKRPFGFKVSDLGDFYVDDDTRPELRTGPFKLVSAKPVMTLERFPDYYQGTSSVSRVEIYRYSNHRAAWTAMMRGEVNFLHEVNRDAIEFIEAGGEMRAYPLLRPFYLALVFNVKHPVLQPRDVRLALNEAIDRDEIVRNGMRTHGEAAEGPFWPHHWAYAPGRHAASYNPEAAKLRLDAAGLKVRRREAQEIPSRFQFTCLLLEGDTRFERIALVVQRQLFDIGVDMRLQPLPANEFVRRALAGDFEAFLFEFSSGRSLSQTHAFWRSGGRLQIGYTAADEALDRMKLASTDDEVRVAVSDVMRIMRSDPPAVFLVWPREARAADRSFELPYETDRDVLGNLWQLRWSPQLSARAR